MVVLCCIVVVTGFLPFPVSRSSLSSPPSQVSIHCCNGTCVGMPCQYLLTMFDPFSTRRFKAPLSNVLQLQVLVSPCGRRSNERPRGEVVLVDHLRSRVISVA